MTLISYYIKENWKEREIWVNLQQITSNRKDSKSKNLYEI